MSDDKGYLSLVIAAVNDETTKARLGQLQAQLHEVEAAQEALRVETERNHQTLVAIQDERRGVERLKIAVAGREADLAAEKAKLTEVINNHNNERSRWEEMRRVVDAQHAALGEQHEKAAAQHAATAAADKAREAELAEREIAVAIREGLMHRKEAAHQAAAAIA